MDNGTATVVVEPESTMITIMADDLINEAKRALVDADAIEAAQLAMDAGHSYIRRELVDFESVSLICDRFLL